MSWPTRLSVPTGLLRLPRALPAALTDYQAGEGVLIVLRGSRSALPDTLGRFSLPISGTDRLDQPLVWPRGVLLKRTRAGKHLWRPPVLVLFIC